MKLKTFLIVFCAISLAVTNLSAQETIQVIPREINDVLTNPGIGFMTFQRFNGDTLNGGLRATEGFPIKYQKFNGNLNNKNYPMTSIAYFRVYWRFLEPEIGKFNWAMIDSALMTAHKRHQTLLLRVAPYGGGSDKDVPDWYRSIVKGPDLWQKKWRVDANDPRYAEYFGRFITSLGKHYDGHPDLEAVDLAIVGFWGEGSGADMLTQKAREDLVNAYTDNFKKTPLLMLLTDAKTNKYGLSQANVGWRVDCLGDLGFPHDFPVIHKGNPGWGHMENIYPQRIINFGMKDAWEKAPVSFEICHVFKQWKEERGYNIDDLNYIINESLKWHISSFNAKSSAVPKEWQPLIDQWLNKMGYRFVLRSFSYPEFVASNEKLNFKSWWNNKGVAPIYKKFLLAIRLTNEKRSAVMITDADITTWMPGDNLYDDAVFVPIDMPEGVYQLQIGIVDRQSHEPKVNLAIAGRTPKGWYSVGKIEIKD
ncbi:MAG TPA: DUF4832 domain-containing protein [Anaerovoracaceae bacterium]|nr:DUF4832 domain-containing protein [Anaerovoracaceae bacterium]